MCFSIILFFLNLTNDLHLLFLQWVGRRQLSGIKFVSMMFKRRRQKHLTPLSKYARKVCDDLVTRAGICRFLKRSNSLQNDMTATKAIDRGQSAASSKKPPCPQTLSPDVGCFVDSPSPGRLLVACDARQHEGGLGSPHSSKREARSVAPSFDLDVDDMLNLSPCGSGCKRVPDWEKSRQPDVSSPAPALPLERSQRTGGPSSASAVNAEGSCLNSRAAEEDGGYCSYRAEDQTESKDLSASAHRQPRQASSGHWHLDVAEEQNLTTFWPPSSRQHSSFLVSDLEIVSGGPRSEPARSPPRKVLESPVEELWSVGLPMLQSSLCHSPSVNSVENASQGECVSEGVMELLKEGGEGLETSCDTESPLQVKVSESRRDERLCAHTHTHDLCDSFTVFIILKVKSVVVTIGQRACRSERAVSQPSSKR